MTHLNSSARETAPAAADRGPDRGKDRGLVGWLRRWQVLLGGLLHLAASVVSAVWR